MKRFERLQFITNGADSRSTLEQARQALEGGCRWVQLRMKGAGLPEVEAVGREMKRLTDSYGAVLIIDDHVEAVRSVGADGVHLGKNDMPPSQARELLGESSIIGGTCNTYADVVRVKDDVDYIGCGPFRFTTTKQNLAPVLGLEGYRELMWAMRSEGINIPVVAIGGITLGDVRDVLEAGPDGIALSGEIACAADPTGRTEEIVRAIESCRL